MKLNPSHHVNYLNKQKVLNYKELVHNNNYVYLLD